MKIGYWIRLQPNDDLVWVDAIHDRETNTVDFKVHYDDPDFRHPLTDKEYEFLKDDFYLTSRLGAAIMETEENRKGLHHL